MATATPCQTHGAVYGIEIGARQISVTVELPFVLDIDQIAETLRANLHNAVELVLAPYFMMGK